LKELSVRSPLAEAGITKNEIRESLLKEGLDIWDKPSWLASYRIPYDTEVSEGMLRMIENAEVICLKRLSGTRVRVHNDIARIECMPGYLEKIIRDPERELIVIILKK